MENKGMTEHELNTLAIKIRALLTEERKNFWVDPEQHYKDHLELHDIVHEWRTIRGMFWKAFVGMGIIGSIAMAGIGSFTKIFK
jgi:hypothetical protein